MKRVIVAIPVLAAVSLLLLVLLPQRGAPPGAWGELTPGSPAASARTIIPNHDFSVSSLSGWSQFRRHDALPIDIPDGEVDPAGGRSGGAYHIGPGVAKKAGIAAAWTSGVNHADWFLDGFARFKFSSGRGWVGIELVFEGKMGQPVSTYLAWKGTPGVAPPRREAGLVEEMSQAVEPGWWRVPTRTTFDLRARGLAMPETSYSITLRLIVEFEDAEGEAWFDDLDFRDMRTGR